MIYNETIYNTGWNTKKLNQLGTFSRGKSTHRPRDDKRLFEDGKYPFIQTGEVKSSNLFISNHKLNYNEFGLLQSKMWKKGTLCITIAANIAETGILSYPMCFPDSIVGFNAYDEEISEIFMYYIFQYIKSSIQRSASGSIQDNINIDYLQELYFKVPDRKAQIEIEKILSNIDLKINNNIQINNNLEELMRTLYQRWFIEFNFPNEDGKPYKSSDGKMVYSEEIKQEIPNNWCVETLYNNRLTSFVENGVEYFESKEYLATGDVDGTDIVSSSIIDFETRESRANMQPQENTVWFAKMKNSIKHLYFGDYSKEMIDKYILSTGFCGLKCEGDYFEYINSFINSDYFEIHKDVLAHGATQEAVNNTDLKGIKLIIPSIDILKKYHDEAYSAFEKIYYNKLENQKLTSLRNFLLPMLMNGQINVDDIKN